MNSNGYFTNGAPVAPNAARERRCPTCGTPADPDAAFCGECGAAIKWEDAANLNVTASGDDVGENALVSEAGADATVGPSFLGVFAYGLKHCFDFKGRATRMEFFAAGVLFAVPGAIAAAIAVICCMLAEKKSEFIPVAICLFGAAAALGCAWLATSVRRFHDIGRSAKLWIALLLLVGIANLLALTLRLDPYTRAFACYEELFAWILGIPFGVLTTTAQLKKGTPGPNRYGPRRLNPSVAVPYDGEVTVGPSYRGAFWYCMKNYCTFKGRATRTEYWGGNALGLGILLELILFSEDVGLRGDAAGLFIGVVGAAFTAIFLTPSLAVVARRAHDLGTSAIPFCLFGAVCWARFLAVTLAISELMSYNFESFVVDAWQWRVLHWLGVVVLLVLGLIPGSKGANRFGKKRCNPSDILGFNDDAQNAKE